MGVIVKELTENMCVCVWFQAMNFIILWDHLVHPGSHLPIKQVVKAAEGDQPQFSN